jgi:hypothetical protein
VVGDGKNKKNIAPVPCDLWGLKLLVYAALSY